jgi:hypothetical protein
VARGNPIREALKAANSIVPSIGTRNTATLTTQKTGHGEAMLGGMLGETCSWAADKAIMV